MDVLQIINEKYTRYTVHIILLPVIVCTIEVFFHTTFGWRFHFLKQA